ncbi:MAG: TRAP transporter small permease [Burkholderiaceae bacterium]
MNAAVGSTVRIIDGLSLLTGRLAAWMYFAVGLFICFEVVMRYGFTMPTIWVDEVSRILQTWATLMAAAYVLSQREHVVIDVMFKQPGTLGRKLADTFAMLVIVGVAGVVCWFGYELWAKALKFGHTTDSFLAPPKWLTHASVWFGFGLLLLQAIAEMVKTWTGEARQVSTHEIELAEVGVLPESDLPAKHSSKQD